MAIATLESAKQHLRIDPAVTVEDDLIQLYLDAAEDWIKNYLDDPLAGLITPDPDDPTTAYIPKAVYAAQLLILGDLYGTREGQVTAVSIVTNPAVTRLLFPYRQNLGV